MSLAVSIDASLTLTYQTEGDDRLALARFREAWPMTSEICWRNIRFAVSVQDPALLLQAARNEAAAKLNAFFGFDFKHRVAKSDYPGELLDPIRQADWRWNSLTNTHESVGVLSKANNEQWYLQDASGGHVSVMLHSVWRPVLEWS